MLGYRRGGIGDFFAAAGERLSPAASRSGAALLGLVIHVAWIATWSALFAAFMQRGRRSGASIPAFLVAALALGVSFVVPDALGGPLATLPAPERALGHLVLAVSFVLGMRLAPAG
jgi:hypothetical protein